MNLYELSMESPLGPLRLVANDDALTGVYLPDHKGMPPLGARAIASHPVLERARAQLSAYFAGRRAAFDLPLAMAGTPFQREVWDALTTIPLGETRAYADLAARLGRPAAVRAVGAANGKNPISIIVPCHRVVGKSGALTGYAGGMEAKRWLLEHERAMVAGQSTQWHEARAGVA
ncbi:methylated-DNA--[protein]-cysteine S-methyltransferase [Polyangium aurulentum]|uniref:methylated-DNA--[protein]-cysteine S-methyltransferase n=1 Tax=Polyangium aurulentum TaxID=2567896 RepID=UPI0010AE057D|nr:methylated-DNA--[protein]-cysteine S-methyltransferase [Polyangium aurulentum]UQA56187.1 methylated-DNA--[protein]-cysteine S-methyltransferase [Polyangium aurulentum]